MHQPVLAVTKEYILLLLLLLIRSSYIIFLQSRFNTEILETTYLRNITMYETL